MVDKFKLTDSASMVTPMITGTMFSAADSPLTPMQVACMCGIPYVEVIVVSFGQL